MGNLLFSEEGARERRLQEEFEAAQRNVRPGTIIFIEGNISAGKSTLIRSLKEEGYPVWEEAVDRLTGEFIDKDGRNLLDLFYSDMEKHAFEMQVASLSTRWKIIKEALQSDAEFVFVERSLLTDRHSFALSLYETGHISQVQWLIYNDLLQQHLSDCKHYFEGVRVKTVYIKTNPEICLERKIGRGTVEEAGVKLDYLESLHKKLEDWQGGEGSHVIDGNQDKINVLRDVLEVLA